MTQAPSPEPWPSNGYPYVPVPISHDGSGRPYADWWPRVGAVIVDSLPPVLVNVVITVVLGQPFRVEGNASGDLKFDFSLASFSVTYGLGLIWFLVNSVYLQGTTGQTIGKKAIGIAVFKTGTTSPPGLFLAFGRYFAHFVDAIACYIGFLWPLWDSQHRTFADMICDTRVYKL